MFPDLPYSPANVLKVIEETRVRPVHAFDSHLSPTPMFLPALPQKEVLCKP